MRTSAHLSAEPGVPPLLVRLLEQYSAELAASHQVLSQLERPELRCIVLSRLAPTDPAASAAVMPLAMAAGILRERGCQQLAARVESPAGGGLTRVVLLGQGAHCAVLCMEAHQVEGVPALTSRGGAA